jgi:hypothetical protein
MLSDFGQFFKSVATNKLCAYIKVPAYPLQWVLTVELFVELLSIHQLLYSQLFGKSLPTQIEQASPILFV